MRTFLFLIACSADFSVQRRAIIGGTRDTGDPAVVMLVSYPSNQSTYFTCTASLIAPSILLTAAHCVDAANHPGYLFGAFTGDDASSYATTAALVAVLVPASAVHPHPRYNPSPPFDADIAIVELSAALPATPLPIARTPPVASDFARLVGYGEISYPNFNVSKYSTNTTVSSIPGDDTVIVGDSQHHSCVGDSGGPALVALGGVDTVIGADSYTNTTGCVEASHYRRTDLYTGFIDPFLPMPAPDLSHSVDLAGVDLAGVDLARPDLSVVPDLSLATDLSTRPPMTMAASGGCQSAPGRPSLIWPLLLLAFTLRRCCSSISSAS
jgi:V8-like Glu-specific endopeptidase